MGNHTTGGESLSVRTQSQGVSAQPPKLLPLILRRDTVPETDTSVGPRSPRPGGVTAQKNRHPQSSKAQDPSRGRQLSPCLFFLAMPLGIQDQTRAPAVGAWNPNHWTSREVPNYLLALKQGPYGPPCHHVAWFQLSERS